jgi:integrase
MTAGVDPIAENRDLYQSGTGWLRRGPAARARGRWRRTVAGLQAAAAACEREGIDSATRINQRFMDRLNAELLDSGLAPASVHSYLRSINNFLRWCEREGEGSKAKAQMPKLPKKLVAVLSRDEIRRLEDAAQTERDKLVVRTLADTGLRLGELLGLRVQDIDDDSRGWRLRVMGKGSKERWVTISPTLGRRLRRYAERGRPRDVNSDRLFITTRRTARTGTYEPLAKRTTEIMCKVLAERAGIDPARVWPHVFRHSYCTHLLKQNISPAKVMQILGHSTMDMVMEVYNQLRPDAAMDDVIRALSAD